MKTLLLIFIGLGIHISCLFSQNILSEKADPSFSNIPVTQLFSKLESQYNVRFFYKSNWLENVETHKVKSGTTLEVLLKESLKPHKLSYIDIKGNNIILIPKSHDYFFNNQQVAFFKVIGNPMEKGKYRKNKVEGYVHFGKTGDPLLGVLVYDRKNNEQTITNKNGYYKIELPPGHTKLEFSFVGLETNTIDIEVLSRGRLDMEMNEAPIELEDITVTAFSGRNNVERAQMGMVHMDIQSLQKLPVLMGETDIIKSMTLLPGVSSSGELASGFNVRGGNADQNLVLINNAPLYGTSHLFGMFSTLMPGAANSIQLHKGTQPANFGSRVSSVTDIRLKDADTSHFGGKAGIGVLNSSLLLEGPVIKDRLSVLVGGRTTYSDRFLASLDDLDLKRSKAGFYDFIAKVDLKLSDKNKLNLFGYFSKDNFKYANLNEYDYGSQVLGMNHQYNLTRTMALKTSLSSSSYNSTVSDIEEAALAYSVSTGISQLNGRMEMDLFLPRNEVSGGVEIIRYELKPGEKNTYGDLSQAIPETVPNEKALEFSGYINDVFKLSDGISLSAGIRYSWYSKIGPATEISYLPNEIKEENTVTAATAYNTGEFVKPYWGFEPRLGVKVHTGVNSSVKAGYTVTRQYQHLISNTATSTPSDFWKSADGNIKPILNQQYSVGYYRNFWANRIETSAEVYYKLSENVLDYTDGAVLVMNPYIEQDIIKSDARAYGIELMVKKNIGRFTGWLSYTLSKSEIKSNANVEALNLQKGKYYAMYNDRLHDLSFSNNIQLSRRWTVGTNFIYSSGRPATFAENKYLIHHVEVVEFSDRNKYRLSPYHRMDISITYEGMMKKKQKVHPSFTFSVYNVYGHKNIYSVYYKNTFATSANNYHRYGFYKLTVIGVPIPSFTLNLNF